MKKIKNEIKFLECLTVARTLIVEASNGRDAIIDATDVFESYINPDFAAPGWLHPEEATPETEVRVYRLINNGKLPEIFYNINQKAEELVMSQSQIIKFCKKYRGWLCHDYPTFFLTKNYGKYIVVSVGVRANGLHISTRDFRDKQEYRAIRRYRFVAPVTPNSLVA